MLVRGSCCFTPPLPAVAGSVVFLRTSIPVLGPGRRRRWEGGHLLPNWVHLPCLGPAAHQNLLGGAPTASPPGLSPLVLEAERVRLFGGCWEDRNWCMVCEHVGVPAWTSQCDSRIPEHIYREAANRHHPRNRVKGRLSQLASEMFIRGDSVVIFINRGSWRQQEGRKEGSSRREQRAQGRRVLSHHSERGPGLAGPQLAQEE